jgi:two-component system phosphate regulon sensor histidine kinase PhoR
LLVGGEIIGALSLTSNEPNRFRENQLPVLQQISDALASAVEHSRLFQAERKQRELAEALERAAAIVSSTLNPAEVLDRILEQVEQVVTGDTSNIILIDNGNGQAVRWRGYNRLGVAHPPTLGPLPIAHFPSLTKMAQSGASLLIPDTASDPDWVPLKGREWLRSYVAAPIRVRDLTVGFLSVNGTRPGQFNPADARRLEAFAAHAATAIENADLYQALLTHAEQLEQRVQERTAQLQAQYARLQAILHGTSDGIVVTDRQGEIIQTNPVARTWLTQILSPEDAVRLRESVQDLALRAGERPETVLELAGLDLELKAASISEPGGEEATAVVSIHDVSHLKALNRIKSRFVSNVSHELRTPVTTIKLYVALMQRTSPEEKKWGKYLSALAQEADRQVRLVEDILQISRIDTGRLEMEPRPTSLNELTEKAIASHQALAQEQGLTIEHQPAEPGPMALVDSERIMQVLGNLVGNAIRYTPEGGKVVISTGTKKAEGRIWATASVSDTGVGIPKHELPRVFERFFRGERPQAMQMSGTGLGLAIVKEIVALHGGRVTVTSTVNVGTTFTAWLPAAEGQA